jgi:hypothetical protein
MAVAAEAEHRLEIAFYPGGGKDKATAATECACSGFLYGFLT